MGEFFSGILEGIIGKILSIIGSSLHIVYVQHIKLQPHSTYCKLTETDYVL